VFLNILKETHRLDILPKPGSSTMDVQKISAGVQEYEKIYRTTIPNRYTTAIERMRKRREENQMTERREEVVMIDTSICG
jgi:hypothetical protein